MNILNKLSKNSSESAKNIYEELNSHSAAALGTIGHDGLPQLTAVYYSVTEDFVISFATKKETRKNHNIQNNANVQLLMFDESTQVTIQVTGEAFEVTDSTKSLEIIDNAYWIAGKNENNSPPISKLFAGDYIAYQILPKKISMAFYLRPQRGGYDMFEILNFGKN